MNRNLIILIIVFFASGTISIAAEKPCSQYNKITHYKLYKECMKGDVKENKTKSTDNFFSKINKKYKSLREKAPKTGVEIWKKF